MGTFRIAMRTTVALATTAAIVGGLQLAAPEPAAAALPGLERKGPRPSAFDDEPVKSAFAQCDDDQHVVGGGAEIRDDFRNLVRLTQLQPRSSRIPGSNQVVDGFAATAEAPNLQRAFDWQVTAYAICADRAYLDARGYTIVPRTVEVRSTGGPFAETSARCPRVAGRETVAYSAGARVRAPGSGTNTTARGKLGLQMVRTSTPLDIARATAREDNVNFPERWTLTSFAVCIQPEDGIHAEHELAPSPAPGQGVSASCSGLFRLHGVGGGGGLVDGGPVWLRSVFPLPGLRRINVQTTGPFPDGQLLASATCTT